MARRVLLAGLFHETHTFLEGVTTLEQFQVRRGEELLAARGDGSPLAGVIEVADDCGWEVLPAIDMRATPSATVADDVVETFWGGVRLGLERELAKGLDGIALVLHGAMASESIRDVEGEIVSRIRSVAGDAVPICGVLDLHGNISKRSVELTQGMVAYRENPHTDAQAAAIDGARLLDRILRTGKRPVSVWVRPPVMWPPTGTGTANEPMRTLEAMARQIERADSDIAAINVFAGFSFGDTPFTGVSFSAVTFGDPDKSKRHLARLCAYAQEHRHEGSVLDQSLASVMPEVAARTRNGEGPILIVEPADNIGGGAPGDATTVLRALIEHRIENSVVVINDPLVVDELRNLAPGESRRVSIGGKVSGMTEGPVELDVELVRKTDGRFDLEDLNSHLASINGVHIDMGPCAVVRHGGVQILLTSRKTPPFDLGQLRSQGIEPEEMSVIGVKAAVAHRRAYDKIAKGSYTVATPGPCSSDLKSFAFRHVRRPIYPLDEI